MDGGTITDHVDQTGLPVVEGGEELSVPVDLLLDDRGGASVDVHVDVNGIVGAGPSALEPLLGVMDVLELASELDDALEALVARDPHRVKAVCAGDDVHLFPERVIRPLEDWERRSRVERADRGPLDVSGVNGEDDRKVVVEFPLGQNRPCDDVRVRHAELAAVEPPQNDDDGDVAVQFDTGLPHT